MNVEQVTITDSKGQAQTAYFLDSAEEEKRALQTQRWEIAGGIVGVVIGLFTAHSLFKKLHKP